MQGRHPTITRVRRRRALGIAGRVRLMATPVLLGLCLALPGCVVVWGSAPDPSTETTGLASPGTLASTTEESSPPDQTVDVFPAQAGALWGLIDKTGTFVVEPQYEGMGDYGEGLVPVTHGVFYGDEYIDRSGQTVLKLSQGYGDSFSEGLAVLYAHKKYGYIDKMGATVIEPEYAGARGFHEGLALVQTDWSGPWCGFIDKTGRKVIGPGFYDAYDFADGLAPVEVYVFGKLHGVWGFIDRTGRFVIEPQFDHAFSFGDGLAPVEKDGKWGFINRAGEFVIEPQYGSASSFSEGLAAVAVGPIGMDALNEDVPEGKWGFIDTTGQFVIEPQYRSVDDFRGGLALIGTLDGLSQYIDASGNVVYSWRAPSPAW